MAGFRGWEQQGVKDCKNEKKNQFEGYCSNYSYQLNIQDIICGKDAFILQCCSFSQDLEVRKAS